MAGSKPGVRGPAIFTHRPEHGMSFGVLRRQFSGRNDVVTFVGKKLYPASKAPECPHSPWAPTAVRWDVLLPRSASDLMRDPAVLSRSFEATAPPTQASLMLHLKVEARSDQPLHVAWELARRFAFAHLVDEHGLPVVIIQHHPGVTGHQQAGKPHSHICCLARTLDLHGWGATTGLAVDEARFPLAEAWRDMSG